MNESVHGVTKLCDTCIPDPIEGKKKPHDKFTVCGWCR